ncbi:hypothetical protein PRIC2_010552 [Phytophthora ramorum]
MMLLKTLPKTGSDVSETLQLTARIMQLQDNHQSAKARGLCRGERRQEGQEKFLLKAVANWARGGRAKARKATLAYNGTL